MTTPGILQYEGQGGSADDLTPLQTAVTNFHTTYGVYPSLVIFSGITCLSGTWSPQQGINIAGAGYQLNRFGGTPGGPALAGAIIAPFSATQSGPLIEFGAYSSGWGSSPYGEQPHISNLAFSGRQKALSSNASVPGLVAIAAEDVADGRIDFCSFEDFDRCAQGSGGVIGGCVRIESSAKTNGFTSEGWRINGCQMVNSAYGVLFLGPSSTDCVIHDVHTNALCMGVVLGLGSSDNAGGAILSDCHFVGDTASNTVASGSNGVNVSTFTGTQTLDVASSSEFKLASGTAVVSVATSAGTALISYTATATGQLQNCTLVSGSGTLSTGGAVNIVIQGSTLTGSSSSTENLPQTKSHVYVGPGPGGQCNWRMSNSYLDVFNDPASIPVSVNALNAQIIGNYFLANAAQDGPAFIVFGSGISTTHGPDCIIEGNMFDQGSSATGSPGMYAIAQFDFITLPSLAYVGTIRNNRFRAGGSAMISRTDTGVTVTNTSATVTDSSCKATDLNALVNQTHFPIGSTITSVNAGHSFVVSSAATSGSTQITIYPCPGIVDSGGDPFTLPQSTGLGYFEAPGLPQ
jgi:hypothetical protein